MVRGRKRAPTSALVLRNLVDNEYPADSAPSSSHGKILYMCFVTTFSSLTRRDFLARLFGWGVCLL